MVWVDTWVLWGELPKAGSMQHKQAKKKKVGESSTDFACGKTAGNVRNHDPMTTACYNVIITSWAPSIQIMIL